MTGFIMQRISRLGLTPVALSMALVLSLLTACPRAPETPTSDVCFTDHVVPLMRRDCALCHYHGEYLVQIRGVEDDYGELMRYVRVEEPADSSLLTWAAGRKEHPVVWNSDDDEYATTLAWIQDGALRACLDHDLYGDCLSDDECPPVVCICDDGTPVDWAGCVIDEDSGLGACGTAADCQQGGLDTCP